MSETGGLQKPAASPLPVLIVGAGPTGLTLGIELARRGIPFRLIDRERERPTTSRALGTQPRTVEVFDMMGIPTSELHPATQPRGFQFMEGPRTLGRVEFADRAGRPALLVMNEADTERVLEARLEAAGGHVERGVEFAGFRTDGVGIIATLRDSEATSDVPARFLIGCDGANSTVRRDAEIAFTGSTYPERFLLADLELDWQISHDVGTVWFGHREGLVAAIPLPAERQWRLIVAFNPEGEDVPRFSEAEAATRAEEELRRRAEIPVRRVGDPLWASAFHVHRKIAGRYRVGSVFLAGDAAHVHSPVGGQGMNTGIQDAFNLGWKLALAAQGLAAPGLLDSYEDERRPVAQAVLRATDAGTRIVLGANPVGRAIREYVFPTVLSVTPIRDRLQAALSELAINYRASSLSVDTAHERRRPGMRNQGGLRAGDRVPDASLLAPRTGETITLFELFSSGWTMLVTNDDPGASGTPEAVVRLIAQTHETVGDMVRPYLIQRGGSATTTTDAMLSDVTGEALRQFGPHGGQVLLVRPDGYLGFRGDVEQPGELASYLARVFAMQLREPTPSA